MATPSFDNVPRKNQLPPPPPSRGKRNYNKTRIRSRSANPPSKKKLSKSKQKNSKEMTTRSRSKGRRNKHPHPLPKSPSSSKKSTLAPTKVLPPTRIRASTHSVNSSNTNTRLSPIKFNNNDINIDNTSVLTPKPKKNKKKQPKTPPPAPINPIKSKFKKNKKKNNKHKRPLPPTTPPPNLVDNDQKTDINSEPSNTTASSGKHQRQYSIVKSIPLLFRKKKKDKNKSLPPNSNNSNNVFASKDDPRSVLMYGSCHCKSILYELFTLPLELQHCYCSICRKIHGSSSATWTPLLQKDIRWIKFGKQIQYKSSESVIRSFCGVCGSNISLKYSFQSETIWLTPALFDNNNNNDWWLNIRVLHIFCASKCEWYNIPNDGNPQLSQIDIQNSEINGEPRFVYKKKLPPKPISNAKRKKKK